MACLSPITGYRSLERNPDTKRRGIVYHIRKGFHDRPTTIPCGQCIECKLEKSRQWAMRAVAEAKDHNENCVVTLTYAEEHLPENGSIKPKDAVKFMKDLREYARRNTKQYFRSMGCAEYGELRGRPHYHIILFGYDFHDKKITKESPEGLKYYTSDILEQIWGKGGCQLMELNFETAAYVARYVTKKLTGPRKEEYENKLPEQKVALSMRPGIGTNYYKKYGKNIYTNDRVIMRGLPMQPPKFFDKKFEIDNPEQYANIKIKRRIAQQKREKWQRENHRPMRAMSRKINAEAKAKKLKREYENDT